MAFITDKDFIYNKMRTNNLAFYKVLDSDGKTLLDQQDDPDITAEEAAVRLSETLDKLNGLVNIVLSAKSGKEKNQGGAIKGDIKLTIKLSDGSISGHDLRRDEITAIKARESEAVISALKDKHESEIKALHEKYKREAEMKELRDQIKELKDGNNMDKYLPMIAGLFGVQPGAVAGFPEQQEPHITGTDDVSPKERLAGAINRILKVDRNFIEHIELLANLAENNSLIYFGAIQKLKTL
jgi:hypothetical protein